VLLGLFALLVGIGETADGLTHVEAIYTSPSLIGFCFGTILAQAYRHGWVARLSEQLRWLVIVAPFGLLVAFYVVDWDSVEHTVLWKHLLMSFSALSIVWLGLSCEAANRLAYARPLKYLGDASYSVYLFHLFAVAAVWAVAKRIFDLQQPLAYLACAALAIVAGLAFGLVCHHLIERPFLAAGTRRSRRAVPAT
jgi:exopolysaccharide production protein ExoZ